MWHELGEALARDVPGLDSGNNTLDSISAYEQSFGRVALVDKIARLIRAHDAVTGETHKAIADLGFETVITTNFDFLLERAYQEGGRPCHPVVDELQLSGPNRYAGPRLIKMHGDVHHPNRLVLTEDDYDNFLIRYPLLATSVTALLVDRTAILIGYSLDDPDTRQLLAVIRSRLGPLTRPLWSIQIGAPSHVVSRYERRGVKVVNLPTKRGLSYGEQLAAFLRELGEYWRDHVLETGKSSYDRTSADLLLPAPSSRMCFFAVPAAVVAWYREYIFPVVEAEGLVPVVSKDVSTPPGTHLAKNDALLSRARLVVVEPDSPEFHTSLLYDSGAAGTRSTLVVTPSNRPMIAGFDGRVLIRPARPDADPEQFIANFTEVIRQITRNSARSTESDAIRLMRLKEPRAALITAIALLETTLSKTYDTNKREEKLPGNLRSLLRQASVDGKITPDETATLSAAQQARNEAVHTNQEVNASRVKEYVDTIIRVVNRLELNL